MSYKILEAVGRMFSWIFEQIFIGLVSLLDLLPIPFDASGAVQLVDSIPDGVWYFASAFQIQTGAGIIFGSFLTRFIIRRIPLIG